LRFSNCVEKDMEYMGTMYNIITFHEKFT